LKLYVKVFLLKDTKKHTNPAGAKGSL